MGCVLVVRGNNPEQSNDEDSVMVDNGRITKLISMSMDDELPQESQRELEQQLSRDKRTRLLHEVMLAIRKMFERRETAIQVELPAEARLRLEERIRAAFLESDATRMTKQD